MAEERTQAALVADQFGSRAAAYLTSVVHARGEDLDQLVRRVEGRKEARVLDLGCGAGHVTFAVAPRVREVIAYDLAPEMLTTLAGAAAERGLGNIAIRQGAAEDLPFPNADFDVVLSRYSAHHWHDLGRGLAEVARVLKPGGIFSVVDTVSPGRPLLDTHLQSVELLRDPSHVRDYACAEWAGAIVGAGLIMGAVTAFRVRLDFSTWTERMRTPPVQAAAIRALQHAASTEVTRRFAIGADGSFTIDVALFDATKPPA